MASTPTKVLIGVLAIGGMALLLTKGRAQAAGPSFKVEGLHLTFDQAEAIPNQPLTARWGFTLIGNQRAFSFYRHYELNGIPWFTSPIAVGEVSGQDQLAMPANLVPGSQARITLYIVSALQNAPLAITTAVVPVAGVISATARTPVYIPPPDVASRLPPDQLANSILIAQTEQALSRVPPPDASIVQAVAAISPTGQQPYIPAGTCFYQPMPDVPYLVPVPC